MIDTAIAGALGGLVKSIVEQKGKVALPKIEETIDEEGQKTKYVHLGATANVVLGAIVSYYMALDALSGFTSGITAVFFAEKLLEKGVQKLA